MRLAPKPARRCATRVPMRPRPTMPIVFSKSSMPVYLDRFHSPAFIDWLASGMKRASERMWPTASSAAEMMLEVGALTTMTPAVVAVLMSTLSRPTPARAITLSRGAPAIASASIFVADRISTALASASAGSRAVRSAPLTVRISKSGPRASIVAGESSSAMRTTGFDTADLRGFAGRGECRAAQRRGEAIPAYRSARRRPDRVTPGVGSAADERRAAGDRVRQHVQPEHGDEAETGQQHQGELPGRTAQAEGQCGGEHDDRERDRQQQHGPAEAVEPEGARSLCDQIGDGVPHRIRVEESEGARDGRGDPGRHGPGGGGLRGHCPTAP